MKKITIDGNTAAAMATYAISEAAIIYPITPSSPMAEACDEWSNGGKLNIYGDVMNIVEMQSEAGAAGAVHGSLLSGTITTTFTASQGLLLMIPNMYKIAGELLPCVFNVAARTIATHALSIFGDHSDVMACRQTGFTILASANVQECYDFGILSHMTALNSSLPVMHFFDGFRTSHEINKIEVLENEEIKSLINFEKIKAFKKRALNPNAPRQFGTAQNPDVFFQNREASQDYYDAVGAHFKNACESFYKLTGRKYSAFEYYGASDAKRVIVSMASSVETLQTIIDEYNKTASEKAGVVKINLYRPFFADEFVKCLPESVEAITVLDRTKECGAGGEPLYLDVCGALKSSKFNNVPVLGGRYGLGGKDFTPSCALAVIENTVKNGKNHFTVGIIDDMNGSNLELKPYASDSQNIQCMFYGLGSDGTVSANKNTIKIIGDNTDMNAQGYFVYDSKKSGSVTISHLRFGKESIRAPYEIEHADLIACHNPRFIGKYDFIKKLKNGGTLLLNCDYPPTEIARHLPASFKRELAERNISFYIIDAFGIAKSLGLNGKINTIMQSAFFKVANILPYDTAIKAMKEAAKKSYGKAGDAVVNLNYRAIDEGGKVIKIEVTQDFFNAVNEITTDFAPNDTEFAQTIMKPIAKLEGDSIPVSAFSPDGSIPTDTARFEKRGIAVNIPCWIKENCIQCNMCSFVCPHGAIKPVLIENGVEVPKTFDTVDAKDLKNKKYRLQISPLDCTGCGCCVNVCPALKKALVLKDGDEQILEQRENYNFASTITNPPELYDKFTLKGSQFAPNYFQFSGACAGCGETPYIKLVTSLYGDKMLIANATGCSSIYGGSFPSCPYTKDESGRGPAWANSLFEDNAEFGFGMRLSLDVQKSHFVNILTKLSKLEPAFTPAVTQYLQANTLEDSDKAAKNLLGALENVPIKNAEAMQIITELFENANKLNDKAVWIIGGDGWAYDIDYGGLDHVLASGKNVNILVLDSQVYSNTGGQASKATPMGAVAKFADGGKRTSKKNLGLMAMSYPDVYVAQIAMGANMNQALTAIKEAAEYDGVSLIIAYSTCINHGIDMSQSMLTMRQAVQSGYWNLFRYNPNTRKLTLDSPKPTLDYIEFAKKERRYANLFKKNPEHAQELLEQAKKDSEFIRSKLEKLASE